MTMTRTTTPALNIERAIEASPRAKHGRLEQRPRMEVARAECAGQDTGTGTTTTTDAQLAEQLALRALDGLALASAGRSTGSQSLRGAITAGGQLDVTPRQFPAKKTASGGSSREELQVLGHLPTRPLGSQGLQDETACALSRKRAWLVAGEELSAAPPLKAGRRSRLSSRAIPLRAARRFRSSGRRCCRSG
jgi:hypothetical protein